MARGPRVPAKGRQLPPERHAALLEEIGRIAEEAGCRRGGEIEWEELERAAGLTRGALSGARKGSRTNPDTLVVLAHHARESPWHLLNPLCGTSYWDALTYLREWAERQHITPQMLAQAQSWALLSEEDRQDLLAGLRLVLRALRPPIPDAGPEPNADPSEPALSTEPDAVEDLTQADS